MNGTALDKFLLRHRSFRLDAHRARRLAAITFSSTAGEMLNVVGAVEHVAVLVAASDVAGSSPSHRRCARRDFAARPGVTG